MSLICIAIVGKDNAPLYLRDFDSNPLSCKTSGEKDTQNDVFGLFHRDFDLFNKSTTSTYLNNAMSLQNQLVMHSALDLFMEKIPSNGNKTMWLGLLGYIDECKIYGYLTSTKIKFMASIHDVHDGKDDLVREAGLKSLFSEIHNAFTQYTLNPFTKNNTKIQSSRFDTALTEVVSDYNDRYGKKGSNLGHLVDTV
jgi:hypothetical protein